MTRNTMIQHRLAACLRDCYSGSHEDGFKLSSRLGYRHRLPRQGVESTWKLSRIKNALASSIASPQPARCAGHPHALCPSSVERGWHPWVDAPPLLATMPALQPQLDLLPLRRATTRSVCQPSSVAAPQAAEEWGGSQPPERTRCSLECERAGTHSVSLLPQLTASMDALTASLAKPIAFPVLSALATLICRMWPAVSLRSR